MEKTAYDNNRNNSEERVDYDYYVLQKQERMWKMCSGKNLRERKSEYDALNRSWYTGNNGRKRPAKRLR